MSDVQLEMSHPFAELLGIKIDNKHEGHCTCSIPFSNKLLNPNDVVHGGVIYSLADTGMGGALQSVLCESELCATIEVKITYLNPAIPGSNLVCHARVLKKGRRVAMMESDVYSDDRMIAKASGSFAVLGSG